MGVQDNIVDYKEIGRRIRKQRIDKHYTQEQAAELVGISLLFLGHIERGSRILSLETLARISRAFDVDMHYLVFGCSSGYSANSELLDDLRQLMIKYDVI